MQADPDQGSAWKAEQNPKIKISDPSSSFRFSFRPAWIPGAQGQNNLSSCKMDVRRDESGVKRDPETIEVISQRLPKGTWERKWVLLQSGKEQG